MEGTIACIADDVSPGPSRSASLFPCLPNPLTFVTVIRFSLMRARDIRLTVHDITGREVAVLADGHHERGEHGESWDGRAGNGEMMSPGVYFAHLEAEDYEASEKLILLR